MLEVRCGNCTRQGRLRIDKLIDEYGRDMSLPDLRVILAGDCEHRTALRRGVLSAAQRTEARRCAMTGDGRGETKAVWRWIKRRL